MRDEENSQEIDDDDEIDQASDDDKFLDGLEKK